MIMEIQNTPVSFKLVSLIKTHQMKNIISFERKDAGEPFLQVTIDYNHFNIGDKVYYELTANDRELLEGVYPHSDCEGIISYKWINISDQEIHWKVEIDF